MMTERMIKGFCEKCYGCITPCGKKRGHKMKFPRAKDTKLLIRLEDLLNPSSYMLYGSKRSVFNTCNLYEETKQILNMYGIKSKDFPLLQVRTNSNPYSKPYPWKSFVDRAKGLWYSKEVPTAISRELTISGDGFSLIRDEYNWHIVDNRLLPYQSANE